MQIDPRHEYTGSLRVFSKNRSLADLTAILGDPTDGHDVGDRISSRRLEGMREESRWGLKSTAARTNPLDEHIEELVTFVEDHREAFGRLRADCEIDIFCSVFSEDAQGGFTVEPSLSRRLSELQLPVVFDIY